MTALLLWGLAENRSRTFGGVPLIAVAYGWRDGGASRRARAVIGPPTLA